MPNINNFYTIVRWWKAIKSSFCDHDNWKRRRLWIWDGSFYDKEAMSEFWWQGATSLCEAMIDAKKDDVTRIPSTWSTCTARQHFENIIFIN